jgi:hypothetical protein
MDDSLQFESRGRMPGAHGLRTGTMFFDLTAITEG